MVLGLKNVWKFWFSIFFFDFFSSVYIIVLLLLLLLLLFFYTQAFLLSSSNLIFLALDDLSYFVLSPIFWLQSQNPVSGLSGYFLW